MEMERVQIVSTRRRTADRPRLNKSFVDSLVCHPDRQPCYFDRELKGFGVYTTTRSKVYFAEKVVEGRSCRVKIGEHGHITAEQARTKAQAVLGQMAQGINPNAEKERARQAKAEAERSQITLNALWEEFKEHRQGRRSEWTIYHYGKYIATAFGGGTNKKTGFKYEDWASRPIQSITRDDVVRYHRRLAEAGPYYANGALRTLSTLLTYAIKRGLLKENPVEVLKGDWFPEERRTRTIAEGKLPAWLKAVDDLRHSHETATADVAADYLEFVLLTGARKTEAACLRWENIDWDQKAVTFIKTKNGKPHTLPLSDRLVTILETRKADADRIASPWVFPAKGNRKGKAGHIVDPQLISKRITSRTGITFSIHDLRRVFITIASPRFPETTVKMLVNHSRKGDVTYGYDQPSPEDRLNRLRVAMQALTDYFMYKKAEGQQMRLAVAQ
jgi:integrase